VPGYLEVSAIPSFEDVDIGIMDLGIEHIISGTVFGTKMFCTEAQYEKIRFATTTINSQCRRSLGTKLAVEDKNRFSYSITADGWFWFCQARAQQ